VQEAGKRLRGPHVSRPWITLKLTLGLSTPPPPPPPLQASEPRVST
jgi:hypothetical protein